MPEQRRHRGWSTPHQHHSLPAAPELPHVAPPDDDLDPDVAVALAERDQLLADHGIDTVDIYRRSGAAPTTATDIRAETEFLRAVLADLPDGKG